VSTDEAGVSDGLGDELFVGDLFLIEIFDQAIELFDRQRVDERVGVAEAIGPTTSHLTAIFFADLDRRDHVDRRLSDALARDPFRGRAHAGHVDEQTGAELVVTGDQRLVIGGVHLRAQGVIERVGDAVAVVWDGWDLRFAGRGVCRTRAGPREDETDERDGVCGSGSDKRSHGVRVAACSVPDKA
jgi:hypothetical protein